MSYSKVFKQTLTLLFTAALLASGLGTAQAALTHDLLITPNEGSQAASYSGSGQVTFNSSSGSGIGGVSAFSFAGTVDGTATGTGIHPFSLGIADLTEIVWDIDSAWNLSIGFSTGNVTSIPGDELCLIFVINTPSEVGCGFSGTVSNLEAGDTRADLVLIHFTDSIPTSILGNFGVPSSTPVHSTNPVPEPSTMILLGTGLAGIIAWRRKHVA